LQKSSPGQKGFFVCRLSSFYHAVTILPGSRFYPPHAATTHKLGLFSNTVMVFSHHRTPEAIGKNNQFAIINTMYGGRMMAFTRFGRKCWAKGERSFLPFLFLRGQWKIAL